MVREFYGARKCRVMDEKREWIWSLRNSQAIQPLLQCVGVDPEFTPTVPFYIFATHYRRQQAACYLSDDAPIAIVPTL